MHACENTTQFYQPTTANEAVLLHQENYKRSQNEQVLYNEWQKVVAEKRVAKRHDWRDATTYK
jgi:hypothetical protein